MTFQNFAGTGPAVVKLHQVKPKQFELLEGFRYTTAAATYAIDPVTLGETDLASVPFAFRWFVRSYGRHTLPALLHDCLVRPGCSAAVSGGGITREAADDIFLEAMKVQGVPFFRRHLMWSAVSVHTRFSFSGLRARLLTIAWAIVAVLGIAAVVIGLLQLAGGASTSTALLIIVGALGPIPGALLWLNRWRAGLWFGYAVVLLLPSTLVIYASFLPYQILERTASRRDGNGPPSYRHF
jgi:hypothetical protein